MMKVGKYFIQQLNNFFGLIFYQKATHQQFERNQSNYNISLLPAYV